MVFWRARRRMYYPRRASATFLDYHDSSSVYIIHQHCTDEEAKLATWQANVGHGRLFTSINMIIAACAFRTCLEKRVEWGLSKVIKRGQDALKVQAEL